ncbi:hypothetical protein DV495_001214 [Geotrichum candidum]|nr:hypothetical protein DV495_001214 [Geotrichum candidum]KAF7499462.1 hypothetical protein DV113_002521 [Geotrichum candidum]KAI8135435.1 hypothetical protein DUD61_000931 [Geotrichum candidum]KAI9211540.1 hypothetical protein DS838_003589 [Geotrichum bryndzae]
MAPMPTLLTAYFYFPSSSAFIALSNRDEYFRRPTSRAKFWQPPHDNILGPYDLARPEHGTWIGISKQGRLAILLNFHELNSQQHKGAISRGLFPKEFLQSDLSTQDWIAATHERYGDEGLKSSGGFTMLCGVLRQAKNNKDRIEPFGLLSNRGAPALKLFDSNLVEREESLVVSNGTTVTTTNDDDTLVAPAADSTPSFKNYDILSDTIGVSNSQITDPWPKVYLGVQALDRIVHQAPVSEACLIEQLKDILVHDTFPLDVARKEVETDGIFYHVRKSIFIPPINVSLPDNIDSAEDGTYYGTRTNTIILVSKTGHVKYIERTLHEHDTPIENHPPQESVFEFDIEGFNNDDDDNSATQ